MHLPSIIDWAEEAVAVGVAYSWWRGDPIPELPPLPGFCAGRADDPDLLGSLIGIDSRKVTTRITSGHVPYVAYLRGQPVACGWSAWRRAQIGELGIEFDVPERNRYLWDFLTLPHLRGMGVYPRLLQAILEMEKGEAERFWIGHDLGNVSSGKGILKAGFRVTARVWVREGEMAFIAVGDRERAETAASFFHIPLLAGA